jgi:transcriptional regulator GlxA family with amidase domain
MTKRIIFVVAPDFEMLDLSGPACAFNSALKHHSRPYGMAVISSGGGQVPSSQGISVETASPDSVTSCDTLVAVGGPKARADEADPGTIRLIRSLAGEARRVTSICTGAFYLAESGLLDGRRATTHWRWAPLLQSRFPAIRVDADRIYIQDGKIWTSAGITAGIDMALAMIEDDCGAVTARAVARDMLVYYRRSGGQSQFSAILELEPASSRIREALAFAREHLRNDLSVERLAEVACISPRQFARVFVKETGETPARAIERLRAEVARGWVEESAEPIEKIAAQTGFGDPERMRRAFIRLFGQSPQALRRIARADASVRLNDIGAATIATGSGSGMVTSAAPERGNGGI